MTNKSPARVPTHRQEARAQTHAGAANPQPKPAPAWGSRSDEGLKPIASAFAGVLERARPQ